MSYRRPRLRIVIPAVAGAAAVVWMSTALALNLAGPAAPAGTAPSSGIAPSVAATATWSASASPRPRWRPAAGDTFQIQYSGPLDLSVSATVYDLDAGDTSASTLATLHAQGRHVLCYVDAGSWESYRADAAAFAPATLGKTMEDWPDERWLDIRRIDLLASPLRARLDSCAAKGFDGVDADNVDGYANDTGFPLTAADQLRFNRWLAAEAHARGLAIALKNDGQQAAVLEPDFDAAVVEQCVEYDECELYGAFIAAGKPVFDIEYSLAPSAFCPAAAQLGFEIIRKRLELDAYRLACPA
jgi:hypothetical protein